MAVRGPVRGAPLPPPAVTQPSTQTSPTQTSAPARAPRNVEALQVLINRGRPRSPVDAPRVVKALLVSLGRAGLRVPVSDDDDAALEAVLEAALQGFQESVGLPPHGRLDEATERALRDRGHLRPGGAEPGSVDKLRPPRPGASEQVVFDRSEAPQRERPSPVDPALVADVPVRSAFDVEAEGASARVDWMTPETDAALRDLTRTLAKAGFASRKRGAAKLKDSIQKFQAREGLERTGALDEPTARALAQKGLLDKEKLPAPRRAGGAAGGEGADDVDEEGGAASAGPRGSNPAADLWGPRPGAARMRKLAKVALPDERELAQRLQRMERNVERQHLEGILMEPFPLGHARPDVEKLGIVDVDPSLARSRARRRVGAGGELDDDRAQRAERGSDEGAADLDGQGTEADGGRAALRDDGDGGEAVGEGDDAFALDADHYEVPPLWFQIEDALERLRRDDEGRGAATYAWDLTLYTPGVYRNDHSAPVLLHLVVSRAGVFDKVWEEVRFALNTRLLEHEPDAPRIGEADLVAALRRARVRADDGAARDEGA